MASKSKRQGKAVSGDLFVAEQRDRKLGAYVADLVKMGELVNFDAVAAAADQACPRPDGKLGGRPPYPTLVMVKVLFVQALYNLSDEQMEHQLLDRRSFQRFCGLLDELNVPDARTLWLFKQRLVQAGTGAQAIFDAVGQQLQAAGYIARGGQMVDATIVRAPIQHMSQEERDIVNQQAVPKDWGPKKTAHKDCDARWTKKHGKSYFGYKLHANVDAKYKLIRRILITPANIDDGQSLSKVLDASNTAGQLLADRGYDAQANRDLLRERGIKDRIARRTKAGKPPSVKLQARNLGINKTRSRVEHVFGQLHHQGTKLVRAVTLARNELAIALKCAVANAMRWVWLSSHVRAV
jgi:IS5 family transposase